MAVAVTTMIVIAFLVPLGGLVAELARNRALNDAERDAQLVARLVTVLGEERGYAEALEIAGIDDAVGGRPLSLILADGTVVGAPPMAGEDVAAARAGAAGGQSVPGGAAVYVPVVTASGTVVVRVFVAGAELTDNVVRSWIILSALGLALVGIGVWAADRLGRSMVRPVQDLSSAASRLGEGDLTARVDPSGPPELAAVGRRFNELAGRVEDLIQEEREMAADLSHRLRTPLTALRLDIEGLPPGEDRTRLVADLDSLVRAADHVINEARRAGRQDAATMTDLTATAAQRAAFWEALAEEQQRITETHLPGDATPVRIPAADLEAAIDAVLGNVFAHTPEGTPYLVTLEHNDGWARLTIEDGGPGLGDVTALERGESTAGSTGLGLDIARRAAQTAGGRLLASRSGLGGARICFEVPISVSDAP